MFDILYIGGNSLITLLRDDKVMTMDHDASVRMRGIGLFESSPRSQRCCERRDKLY